MSDVTLTDKDYADFTASSYTDTPAILGRRGNDDVKLCIYRANGVPIVVLPGTTDDPRTWLRDAKFLPTLDEDIGLCPDGFCEGARSVYRQLLKTLNGVRPVILGHSLGGAMAEEVAGLLIVNGLIPLDLCTFAPPHSGSFKLGRIIETAIPRARYYHIGDDAVPDFPVLGVPYVRMLNFFRHPSREIHLYINDDNPLTCHRIATFQNYVPR